MVIKIKREDCLTQYPKFPVSGNGEHFFPEVFKGYRLTIDGPSESEQVTLLADAITQFIAALNIDALIFLGDMTRPWLEGNSDEKPAKAALQYLTDHQTDKEFNGAFEVDLSELPLFLEHLTWLTSTNTLVAYVHFMDREQGLIGTVDYSGNVLLSTLNKSTDDQVADAINKTKLIQVEAGY
jgi:hypothetical protein